MHRVAHYGAITITRPGVVQATSRCRPQSFYAVACDVNDHLSGYLKWEQNVPTYVVGRTSDGFEIPARGQLGDLNEDRWLDGKDPWQRVDLLPFWNVESREVLLFTATSGGSRKAVATLVGNFADNLLAHPQDVGRVPLIELSVESYKSRHGNRVFAPIFDIIDWIERPDAVRRVLPPPVKMLDLIALPAPTLAPAPAPVLLSTPTPTPTPTKPKRSTKSTAANDGDLPYDDSIPF